MVSPTFLGLPRELRDLIYSEVFNGYRKPRTTERRHLTHFTPSPANILLVLHWECLLINTQVAAEAVEILFKRHTVLLRAGPLVVNSLFYRIEQDPTGKGQELLQSLRHLELDWTTFPSLRHYPGKAQTKLRRQARGMAINPSPYSEEEEGADLSEDMGIEGPSLDDEGIDYDDNHYAPSSPHQWSSYQVNASTQSSTADPFGLLSHYPFSDPNQDFSYSTAAEEKMFANLEYLIYEEVTPLFHYLSSPTFCLSSMSLPLHFIKRSQYQRRILAPPQYAVPLTIRYWVHVIAHALVLLHPPYPDTVPKLKEVRVQYKPKNLWAALDPCDDLGSMCENGVWGDGGGSGFRAVWDEFERLRDMATDTRELDVDVKLVRGGSSMYEERLGDELEVTIKRYREMKSTI